MAGLMFRAGSAHTNPCHGTVLLRGEEGADGAIRKAIMALGTEQTSNREMEGLREGETASREPISRAVTEAHR